MLAIFTEHFWRHTWTEWSDPQRGIIKEGPSSHEPCLYVARICTICGKIQREVLR